MQTAGARLRREDEQESSGSARPDLRLITPTAERRTVKITGQPTPARRRGSVTRRRLVAQPDRIALWAFLLGLFLVFMAAATAHAAIL
jgi:hypothetical protein